MKIIKQRVRKKDKFLKSGITIGSNIINETKKTRPKYKEESDNNISKNIKMARILLKINYKD